MEKREIAHLSSANAFSLDQSKNLMFGKELNMDKCKILLFTKELDSVPVGGDPEKMFSWL